MIPAGLHVLYDIGESPVLDTLTVQGTLTFATCEDLSDDADCSVAARL